MIVQADEGSKNRTAQSTIAAVLRRSILRGELAPGERVLQSEIAKQMRTSTTPVREALRDLAAEGLVTIDPHRGVRVHTPTIEDLEELYELRLAIESVSIKRVVERITDEELDQAEECLELMEQDPDPARWLELNREFHRRLIRGSRSPRIATTMENLRNLSTMYIGISVQSLPDRFDKANEEHRLILEACRRRDDASAVAAVEQHLKMTAELGRIRVATLQEEGELDPSSEKLTTKAASR